MTWASSGTTSGGAARWRAACLTSEGHCSIIIARCHFHAEPCLHMHHTLAFISAICTKYRPCYWIWISAPSHIRRPLKYIKMKQSHLITPKLIKEEQIGNYIYEYCLAAGVIQKSPAWSVICRYFSSSKPRCWSNFRRSPHEYHVERTVGVIQSFCVCLSPQVERHAAVPSFLLDTSILMNSNGNENRHSKRMQDRAEIINTATLCDLLIVLYVWLQPSFSIHHNAAVF